MLGVPKDDAGRKGGADPAATRTGIGGSAEIAGQHCWSAARRAKEVDGISNKDNDSVIAFVGLSFGATGYPLAHYALRINVRVPNTRIQDAMLDLADPAAVSTGVRCRGTGICSGTGTRAVQQGRAEGLDRARALT